MQYARNKKLKDVTILTDSNLVYQQITGGYRVKGNNLRKLLEEVDKLIDEISKVNFDYVPREYTHEADVLARDASEKGIEKEVEKKYPFLTYKKSV